MATTFGYSCRNSRSKESGTLWLIAPKGAGVTRGRQASSCSIQPVRTAGAANVTAADSRPARPVYGGVGWGIIVSLEAGHFFKAASSEYRLGGFTVMANIREFSPVATGLMIAAVSGTAIVADLGARQVRQELEALSVMGLSNVLFIVVPRALALMVMTALYNIPMIVFTTLSGFLIAVAVVGVN